MRPTIFICFLVFKAVKGDLVQKPCIPMQEYFTRVLNSYNEDAETFQTGVLVRMADDIFRFGNISDLLTLKCTEGYMRPVVLNVIRSIFEPKENLYGTQVLMKNLTLFYKDCRVLRESVAFSNENPGTPVFLTFNVEYLVGWIDIKSKKSQTQGVCHNYIEFAVDDDITCSGAVKLYFLRSSTLYSFALELDAKWPNKINDTISITSHLVLSDITECSQEEKCDHRKHKTTPGPSTEPEEYAYDDYYMDETTNGSTCNTNLTDCNITTLKPKRGKTTQMSCDSTNSVTRKVSTCQMNSSPIRQLTDWDNTTITISSKKQNTLGFDTSPMGASVERVITVTPEKSPTQKDSDKTTMEIPRDTHTDGNAVSLRGKYISEMNTNSINAVTPEGNFGLLKNETFQAVGTTQRNSEKMGQVMKTGIPETSQINKNSINAVTPEGNFGLLKNEKFQAVGTTQPNSEKMGQVMKMKIPETSQMNTNSINAVTPEGDFGLLKNEKFQAVDTTQSNLKKMSQVMKIEIPETSQMNTNSINAVTPEGDFGLLKNEKFQAVGTTQRNSEKMGQVMKVNFLD